MLLDISSHRRHPSNHWWQNPQPWPPQAILIIHIIKSPDRRYRWYNTVRSNLKKLATLYTCIWCPAVLSVLAFFITKSESRRIEANEVAFMDGYQTIMFWVWFPVFLVILTTILSLSLLPKQRRSIYLIQLFLSLSFFVFWISRVETLVTLNP